MGVNDPQTDREFLIRLDGQLNNLAESIDRFSNMLKTLEEKKITAIEQRLGSLEDWRFQIMGGWRVMVIIWTIASGIGIIAGVKYFFMK